MPSNDNIVQSMPKLTKNMHMVKWYWLGGYSSR